MKTILEPHQQALILDFGGVISRALFETHAETEIALGLKPNTLRWKGPFDIDSDPLWQAMQADQLSEREYWLVRTREVGQLAGQEWTQMQDFVKAARGAEPAKVIRPEALKAISQAKQAGYKLAILSNELDLFYGSEFRSRLDFMQWFDVISDATYTEVLKPDPRAYLDCLEELGLPAHHCVFVDDQLRNVKGAEAVGLKTVHFSVLDPAGGYQQALRLLGIED
ncbi:MAG: putative hydrolase of the HAD superfamily [Parasphingorhabdus sp.]|jgi:putative hydrolase of the HAD superfamily